MANLHIGDSAAEVTENTCRNSFTERLRNIGYKESITKQQRRYSLPEFLGGGVQVFCGHIPPTCTENDLFELFERHGKVLDFQLMMNSNSDENRGFAFVTYAHMEEATKCVASLNNYKICRGTYLNVKLSTPNRRLFIGSIPKVKTREMIHAEFSKYLAGICDVIVYSYPDDKNCMNRGFCFIEFETHQAAAKAKHRLETGRIRIWNNDMFVDWADPQEEPNKTVMETVKILYVRNLSSEVTEEQIKHTFETYGHVERVKKMKNYAFVHFENRNCAIDAMNALNGQTLTGNDGYSIEITLSKPPSDKKRKEELLRARERRMLKTQAHGTGSLSSYSIVGPRVESSTQIEAQKSIFKPMEYGCWPKPTNNNKLRRTATFAARPPVFIS